VGGENLLLIETGFGLACEHHVTAVAFSEAAANGN
jgi:hypothetical protein